jgi:nitrous oxidase accessory protein
MGAALFPWALVGLLLAAPGATATRHRADPAGGLGSVVARAQAGDTVVVSPGIYAEDSVLVSCALTLLGEPGAVLDARGGGHALIVRADGVTVAGLGIRNTSLSHRTDHAAILAENCRALVVRDCRLERNFFGVYLAGCTGARIEHNRIEAAFESETRSGNGIHLWHCRDTRITGNRVSGPPRRHLPGVRAPP